MILICLSLISLLNYIRCFRNVVGKTEAAADGTKDAYWDSVWAQGKELHDALIESRDEFLDYLVSYNIIDQKEAESAWHQNDAHRVTDRTIDIIANRPNDCEAVYNIMMMMNNHKAAVVFKAVCEAFGKDLEGEAWSNGKNFANR